jgi:transketolase
MALAAKRQSKQWRVFCLLSDGECDEGSNWEAIMLAAHHELDNLVAVVDYNKIQSLALVADTVALEPFGDKWASFGWTVHSVDGHDVAELTEVLSNAAGSTGRPTVVLANTVKGKGVSFMENSVLWHYRTPRGAELDAAKKELAQQ